MHTIVLATQKGGSGKSTLAIGLARAAIDAGHTVRLIETDQQGTLTNWQARRSFAEPRVDPVYAAGDIADRLERLAEEGVTLTIVDTAGGVGAATSVAIRNADLCLIPARPSVIDIEAMGFVLNFLVRRPFLATIFDPIQNEFGLYQAREVSYVLDFIDARAFAFLLDRQASAVVFQTLLQPQVLFLNHNILPFEARGQRWACGLRINTIGGFCSSPGCSRRWRA